MEQNELKVPGVGPVTLQKLVDAGLTDIKRLARTKLDDLLEIEGMGEKTALKIISYAQEQTGIGGPCNAMDDLDDFNKNARFISTNSKSLDELLGGGIRCGFTWEIAGVNGHGKSQLAMQIAANSIIPKDAGGTGGKCIWIDTENTGRLAVKRIHQIIMALGLPADDIIRENLRLVKCENTEMQVNAVNRLLENDIKYDCVIVDGIMTKFRVEYSGRGTLADRSDQLKPHLDALNNYAMRNDSAVIYTNQVSDSPEMYSGGPRAIGGNIVGHSAKYRLFTRMAEKGAARIVRLDKSADLPQGEAVIRITSEGITDYKKE
jgi:DNA repair protein RadA